MKMFFRTGLWGLVVAGAALFSRDVAGDTIIDNDSVYTTYTFNNSTPTTLTAQSLQMQHYVHVDEAMGSGSDLSTSKTTFDFTNSDLYITTEQMRDRGLTGLTGASGTVFFHVTDDIHYSLSGSFKVNDIDNLKAGESYLFAALYDIDLPDPLFNNVQASDGVADETFYLGGTAGTLYHSVSGSLTGTLLANHNYAFSSKAYTQALVNDSGATSSGSFNLEIAETPEPGIVWAGGALLSIVGARRILSRRKAVVAKA